MAGHRHPAHDLEDAFRAKAARADRDEPPEAARPAESGEIEVLLDLLDRAVELLGQTVEAMGVATLPVCRQDDADIAPAVETVGDPVTLLGQRLVDVVNRVAGRAAQLADVHRRLEL